jgi:hypothetical protein
MARKKPIISPLGQWAYPGEVTVIPSSNITMKGVNYPVLGIDDLGNQQMMMPGGEYTFPGDYVTEIPQMGKGGLRQWFAEEWKDVKTGKPCGRSGKDKDGRPYPACRPSKRVNETTPKTTSEMSSAEKAKFKREKTSGKRIDYNHKRREFGGESWLDQYQDGGLSMGDYDLTTAPKRGDYLLPDINRPSYIDEAGNKRSEYRMGVNIDGRETLIPTVVGGKQLSEDEALDRYYKTGLHMGQFNTPEEADYASRLRTARYNMLEDPIRFQADQFQVGGRAPIYTSNPNDPRLRSYNDSTRLYEQSKYLRNLNSVVGNKVFTPYKNWKPWVYDPIDLKKRNALTKQNILQSQAEELSSYNDIANDIKKRHSTIKPESILTLMDDGSNWPNRQPVPEFIGPVYKKPVQPILYKKPVKHSVYKKPQASPIYTSDLNDPRLKAYNDSLYNYNLTKKYPKENLYFYKQDYVNSTYTKPKLAGDIMYPRNIRGNMKPIRWDNYVTGEGFDNYFPEYSVARYKKPVQRIIYKKPEIIPEVVETPVAPVPVVEPPKPSLAISNIDRDMYTPGGGMGREYNIGVTLQDGSKKAFRTEKEYQDWKAANNLDISNAKVTEGKGYSYDYPENKKYGGWLDQFQNGSEVPSNIERMDPAVIKRKRSWFDKLKGYIHRGEKAIGLDPYNERPDDFMEQWARRINTATGGRDWYKQPNDASGAGGIGTAVMETVMAPFSAPQLASVYGATGKVQMPSEAMNIQNPVGSFLADAVLDPTNLVGTGIAKNLGKGSLQNMVRSRMRGARPNLQRSVDNISNELPAPPLELRLNESTGQFDAYYDTERPYFDQWMRELNATSNPQDVSELFANPSGAIDLRKLKIAKNKSGLTKEEILKNTSLKDKEALSKMSESEFEQTVLKPTGEISLYEPSANLNLGFNTDTRNLTLSNTIPMGIDEYTNVFNSKLDRLNEIISRNNKSGLDYSVKGLSPSGALTFNTPAQIEKLPPNTKVLDELKSRGLIDSEGNISPTAQEYVDRWGIAGNRNIPQGESTWMLDINPGQWRGEVEDIANSEYFKAIPGLNMRNTTASVFSDALPRRGTGTYNSINEYLKELDLGRVKPGFNIQSKASSGLWEDAIKKGKAFGYFNNPSTIYGSMRTVAPLAAGTAAAFQLQEQRYGGWLNKYQDGGENLPELNSKIDIANFYKNPLSEKYGIYQDPEDNTYRYYLKSGKESSILESGPNLSNIDKQKLKEINSKKALLSEIQLSNIKPVSSVILPKQKEEILRDKLYYEQDDLMEELSNEIPIIPPSYKEVLQSIPKIEESKTKTLPNKQKPLKAELNKNIELNPVQQFYADRMYKKYGKVILTDKANNRTIYGVKKPDGTWDLNSFEVLTGQATNFNEISGLSVDDLKKFRNKRGTPIGVFPLTNDDNIYGYPGLRLDGSGNIAYHITYKGPDDLYRSALYNNNNLQDNYRSYGCINCEKPSLEKLLKFAKPNDKALIINSNLGFKNNENWIKKNTPDLYNDLFKKEGGQTSWLNKYK